VVDFRSQPMPSPEGKGIARSRAQKAWDAYARTVKKAATPAVEPAATWLAGRMIQDLAGFWLLWHLEGGFEGLQRIGYSRSAIYRRVASFRQHFGAHPDEYQFPGVTIDVSEYLRAAGRPIGSRDTHPQRDTT
jgi:hypothetical protein